MWGQETVGKDKKMKNRIIPMRVGTSKLLQSFVYTIEDHPHACGDKSKADININYAIGSSPCVWGQGKDKKFMKQYLRIIPMRVGTSLKLI